MFLDDHYVGSGDHSDIGSVFVRLMTYGPATATFHKVTIVGTHRQS